MVCPTSSCARSQNFLSRCMSRHDEIPSLKPTERPLKIGPSRPKRKPDRLPSTIFSGAFAVQGGYLSVDNSKTFAVSRLSLPGRNPNPSTARQESKALNGGVGNFGGPKNIHPRKRHTTLQTHLTRFCRVRKGIPRGGKNTACS